MLRLSCTWLLIARSAAAQQQGVIPSSTILSGTPPRGWNSWDADKQALNEEMALKVAANMVRFLLPHGYDTLVIDGGWSDAYTKDACTDCIDAYGRPQPNLVKWPSSAGGKGLGPFITKMHEMGLKVGMHTLQGSITKSALNAKSPVLGAVKKGTTVNDIAGPGCSWQPHGFGVNMGHVDGQTYLNSVYAQYAEWELDLIKNDCVFANNWDISGSPLIRGVKSAIVKGGYPTVYSLSPGNAATSTMGKNISGIADMYRITSDWHDCEDPKWGRDCGNLTEHFSQAHEFESLIGKPSFPDQDILSPYNLTKDANDPAFRFQMTLWVITRSPLFIGLDLANTTLQASDLTLLTNVNVLEVNSNSSGNRQVLAVSGGRYVWAAEAKASTAQERVLYVALFNNGGSPNNVDVTFAQLGLPTGLAKCEVHDLWTGKQEVAATGGKMSRTLPATTGAELYRLANCS
jgi:hypothetical protein